MRGRRSPQSTMLAFVNLEERVPPDHPLRVIKYAADPVLDRMSGDSDRMYPKIGRASSPSRASAEGPASHLAVFDP